MNRFPRNTPNQRIVEAIQQDGYAIIESVLHQDTVSELLQEIQPELSVANPDFGNPFMGDRTVRFGKLLHRIPTVRKIVLSDSVLPVLDATLLPLSPTYQVLFTGVMHVMEGAKAQVLHRDNSPFPNPGPTVVIATMWAGTYFTRENGATVFVPGSHLWHDSRCPRKEELQVAEMPAGSVLLYAGNLIHGAGACKKGYRTGVSLQYCVGWMRQEENQYLAIPLEVARTFEPELQRIMGYDLAARHWGYVDQQHPMNFLNQTSVYGGLDPKGYEFQGLVNEMQVTVGGPRLNDYYPITLDD
jgi:ectoine hydroxylase-related dioxygenase (phytanoyl-CoA dioxygenase family)